MLIQPKSVLNIKEKNQIDVILFWYTVRISVHYTYCQYRWLREFCGFSEIGSVGQMSETENGGGDKRPADDSDSEDDILGRTAIYYV
jgi:hypothetical protein